MTSQRFHGRIARVESRPMPRPRPTESEKREPHAEKDVGGRRPHRLLSRFCDEPHPGRSPFSDRPRAGAVTPRCHQYRLCRPGTADLARRERRFGSRHLPGLRPAEHSQCGHLSRVLEVAQRAGHPRWHHDEVHGPVREGLVWSPDRLPRPAALPQRAPNADDQATRYIPERRLRASVARQRHLPLRVGPGRHTRRRPALRPPPPPCCTVGI